MPIYPQKKRSPWIETLLIFNVLFLSLTAPAFAELDPILKQAGWDEIEFDDKPTNRFNPINPDQPDLFGGVELVSQDTVSIAFLKTSADLSKTPRLAWEWRVDTPILDTDLTKKGGDDRSLALYVAFPYQPEVASFGEKLKRTAIEALRGKDTPGRVLTYVWGGGAKKGDFVENPYTGEYGKLIFLRDAKDQVGVWAIEDVDLRADFIKSFGYEPASPVFIGIAADSDDTKTRIEAAIKSISFNPS